MNKQLKMDLDDVKYIIGSVMEYAYEAREEAIKNSANRKDNNDTHRNKI